MPINSETNSAYVNPTFINDDSQPPSYSSIYPLSISQILSNIDSKTNNQSNQTQSNSIANENQISSNSNVTSTSLFQNNSEPISYEQLFLSNFNTSQTPSTRFLFENRQAAPIQILFPNNQSNMHNRLRKQIDSQFNKSYLLRHILFITMSSLALIAFQIILMNNNSILSYLGSGFWAGFGNLFTLLLSILTLKYAKLWLLITTLMFHFLCITVSLGGLIIVNCIAATKYTSCSSHAFIEHSMNIPLCNESNLKYGNIAMIVLGATCMLTFTTFFFKLIAVFNHSQTNRE